MVLLCFAFRGFAHNPDTSYTRLAVSPAALDFRFIFDLETLNRLENLDDNKDGFLTREELMAHLPAIHQFIQKGIHIFLDEEKTDLGEPGEVVWPSEFKTIPTRDHQATLIHFLYHKPLEVLPESIEFTYTFFDRLGDLHKHLMDIQQGAHQEEQIIFSRFDPQFEYFTDVEGGLPNLSLVERLFQFLKLGVEHIFTGYDHILFLLALLVVSRFRQLIAIVTAFTLAHTLTLILAASQIVVLPTRLIETGIAATIVYVAVENLFVGSTSHRWVLTFFFGLVHGFGFANVLTDLGLPTEQKIGCLLSFNLGVELGQIAIVLAMLPVSIVLTHWSGGKLFTRMISVIIALFGAAWFIDRVFALKFMPF